MHAPNPGILEGGGLEDQDIFVWRARDTKVSKNQTNHPKKSRTTLLFSSVSVLSGTDGEGGREY